MAVKTMQRILLIGGNGSGKTTLARALGQRLSLPVTHLDSLYWRENWQPVSDAEFDALLAPLLDQPRWIIDGNIRRTLARRLKACDTVIYLDYPAWLCTWRAFKRLLGTLGRSREEINGCIENLNRRELRFLVSVAQFNRRNRGKYYALLSDAPHARQLIFHSPRQLRRWFSTLPDTKEDAHES